MLDAKTQSIVYGTPRLAIIELAVPARWAKPGSNRRENRVIDGVGAARFLQELARLLENPETLLEGAGA
jgi:hypothetical protein